MRFRTIKIAVVILAGCSLFPLAALANSGTVPKDKEVEVVPKEKEVEVVPKEKEVEVVEKTPESPERDGPPEENYIPTIKKTPPVVVRKNFTPSPVHPYSTHANYCPAGLQPVSIDGSVSCGQPNQRHTYQQMAAHPKPRVTRYRSAGPTCGVGTKGCSDR